MALSAEVQHQLFVDQSQLLSQKAFDKVVANCLQTKRPLDQMLMEASMITPEQYLELLSKYFQVPQIALNISDIDIDTSTVLAEQFAIDNMVMIFGLKDNFYQVAMVNPKDQTAIDAIEQRINHPVKVYVTSELALRRALVLYDGDLKQQVQNLVDELKAPHDNADNAHLKGSDVEPLVTNIIETAVLLGASDVHLEPFETELLVRYRLDGILGTFVSLPVNFKRAIAAIIMVEADMKTDQQRLPQDGRFTAQIKGQEVNVRVSVVPSMWGTKIVLRILPKETHLFNLSNLGMLDKDLELVKTYLAKPHGMILVTGPTNSGKTTSLYAFVQQIGLDRIDTVNISTVEDPIEYTMPRITQIQVDSDINLTFTSGLRALLRQDPDIIMVGEIRDSETADFAVQAALVGRLVLSSLHTNNAPATIPRLLDMGVEPYLVASTLSLIVAQRLARKLCDYCRQSYHLDDELIKTLYDQHNFDRSMSILRDQAVIQTEDPHELRFYKAVGCEHCNNTGYRGRIGVYEFLPVDSAIQNAINARLDTDSIRQRALEQGMKTMFEDGLAKVIIGQLDLDELIRVVNS